MNLIEIIDVWRDEIVRLLNSGNALFIACFSTTGDVLYANDAMSFVYEYSPDKSFINPSFKSVLSNNTEGVFFEGVITFGKIHSADNFSIIGKFIKKKDKILIIGELNIQELIDQNKIIRDLNLENNNLNRMLIKEKNALKISQLELRESQNQLIELNATKDKFFSIIAHDLINPLGIFKSMTRSMFDEYDDYDEDERLRVLGKIAEYAENSYDLLNNLLNWSRAQRGILKPNIESINLSYVVKSTLMGLKIQADKKNIEISTQIRDNVPVLADKNLLSTIIRNIVSNAVKFTNNNGFIRITKEESDKKIILKIQDNGVGMEPEIIPKLFRIDSNISTKGTNKEIGTGLGLVLCKEFADKMDVSLKVESTLNVGTSFYIYIPKD